MRYLMAFLIFSCVTASIALPKGVLPPCPKSKKAVWHMCVGAAQLGNLEYDGEWKDGVPWGVGTGTRRRGYSYVGEWRDGVQWGQGTESVEGKLLYTGQWKNGLKDGIGEQIEGDGAKYIGQFFRALYHGAGTLYSPTGEVLKAGIWKMGDYWRPLDEDQQTASVAEASAFSSGGANVMPQPADPAAIPKDKRVALVIGNASYVNFPLANPINDSTDVARALERRGFEVTLVTDASLSEMRQAVRKFADKMVSSSAALVFFSGHGVEVDGRNFFVPVDADIQREFEVSDRAYDATQILEMMQRVPSAAGRRVNILVVDACRNNPLVRDWRKSDRGLARMDAPTGTFIAFSTAPGRVAADGKGRNSPFTRNLLLAMAKPKEPIEQVFKSVRRAVVEETNGSQVPWENSSLIGDFYFTPE